VSVYPVFVEALLGRLRDRTNLLGVNLLDHEPIVGADLRTQAGKREAVWMSGSDGPVDVEVLGGVTLVRFTERLTVPLSCMVLGESRPDDARRTRDRAGQLVAEVLAEIAGQNAWDEAATGLSAWDEWSVLPDRVVWVNDRLETPSGAYGALCRIDLTVTARRTYS
jgi:hypothetical protein